MAYTILLTERAEKDIIRLQKSGEKLTIKKIDALFDELEQLPLQEPDTPNLWEMTGQWFKQFSLLIVLIVNRINMKRILVFTALLGMITYVSAQQPSIIEKVFVNSVEEKITSMQELIGFDNGQAQQLKQIELSYLLDVNKAEHCFLCNKNKRIEKLKQKRDTELQKILVRDKYIKYLSLENDLLNENNRLWLQ